MGDERGDRGEREEGGEERADEVGVVQEEGRGWGDDDGCASLVVGESSAVRLALHRGSAPSRDWEGEESLDVPPRR